MSLSYIIYKNKLMAMWTNTHLTLGQMVTWPLRLDKFLGGCFFSFLELFLLYLTLFSFPTLSRTFLHCTVFPSRLFALLSLAFLFSRLLENLIPKPIRPQHYLWLVLEPPTWSFVVIFNEGTSCCAFLTKLSIFCFTSWTVFLAFATFCIISHTA